ncbi:tetratricopeptide repeat protein [Alteromonas sp. A081]|uniref:tetratricopeptide repeat protein n=1 Tax=Alteromonas sp. A081 TaxID=3410269 RepID=UPI003B9822C9
MKRYAFYLILCATAFSCSQPYKDIDTSDPDAFFEKYASHDAEVLLKESIQRAPENTELRLLLGQSYLHQGKYESAEKEFIHYLENTKSDTLSNTFYELYSEALFFTENQTLLDTIPLEAQQQSVKVATLVKISRGVGTAQAIEQNTVVHDINTASIDTAELTQNNYYLYFAKLEKLFSDADYQQAARISEPLKRLRPFDNQALFYLMLSYYKSGSFQEADTLAQELLVKQSNNAVANLIRSAFFLNSKDFANARKFINIAMREGMENIDASIVAGVSNYHLKNFEQAHEHLTKYRDTVEKNNELRKYLIATEIELGIFEHNAETLPKDDSGVLFGLDIIERLETSNATDKVGPFLEFIEDIDIQNDELSQVANLTLVSRGIPQLTKSELVELLADADINVVTLYISALIAGDSIELALDTLNELMKNAPSNTDLMSLKAASLLKVDRQADARSEIAKLLDIAPNNLMAQKFFAFEAIENKEYEDAIRQFQSILKQKYSSSTMAGLIKASNLNNTLNQSINWLTTLYANAQNIVSNLAVDIAFLNYQNGDIDAAKTYLQKLEDTDNKPSRYYILLMTMHREQRNHKEVHNTIKQWVANRGVNEQVTRVALNYYEMEQQWEAGLEFVQLIKESSNASTMPNMPFINAYFLVKNNKVANAKSLLKNVAPNGSYFNVKTEGLILATENKWRQALEKFTTVYGQLPSTENALLVFKSYQALDNVSTASTFAEKRSSEFPKDTGFKLRYAEWMLVQDPLTAIQLYQELIDNGHKTTTIYNNLAWLLLQNNKAQDAEPLIDNALVLQPSNVSVIDTAISIKLALNKPSAAIELANSAVDKNKGNFSAEILRVETLIKAAKFDEAKVRLRGISPASAKEQEVIKRLNNQLQRAAT